MRQSDLKKVQREVSDRNWPWFLGSGFCCGIGVKPTHLIKFGLCLRSETTVRGHWLCPVQGPESTNPS